MNMVERVARAIFRAERGYESDMCPVTDMLWPTGEEWRNQAWAQFEPAARAAIEALRDNVTDGMIEAGDKAAREKVTVEHYPSGPCLEMEPDLSVYTLDAMLTAALNEEKEQT